jgi:hypothetical protein
MVERFLFDRIDAESATAAIRGQHNLVTQALSNKAEAALALVQLTKTRTQAAFQSSVRQGVPPAAGMIGFTH